jgi:predicted acylesterase/phospholipase RssA
MLTQLDLNAMLRCMQYRYGITLVLTAGLWVGFAVLSIQASPTRDTALDHRLGPHIAPSMDLSSYRSVQDRPDQNPYLAVAMAISGGGHRAANFAAGVLLGLESFGGPTNACNLLNEVDYFSTVSGGGFTAGAYLASRYDYDQTQHMEPYSFRSALEAEGGVLMTHLERDYQSTLLSAGVNMQMFGYKDAGDLLEEQFDNCILGAERRAGNYSLQLGDVFRAPNDPNPVTLPYWFANATVYENGARFVFTPDMLQKYHVHEFTHRMTDMALTNGTYELPFSVAVKTSASFPVAIPATTFVCKDAADPLNTYLHLMDGGLIDNLGVRSAFEALHQDPAPRRILLVVDAYKGDVRPLSKSRTSPSGPQAAYRITKIALDADHGLLKRNVRERAAAAASENRGPIEVVFLSFESLKPKATDRVGEIEEELAALRKVQADAILRRVQREINAALGQLELGKLKLKIAQDAYAVYHDTRAIATSLNITPAEQQLLLRAGQAVVNSQRQLLEQIFITCDTQSVDQ